MRTTSLDQILAEELAHEATQTFKGYSVADLRKRFDALVNPTVDGFKLEGGDWKDPIDAVVDGPDLHPAIIAIEFFTAAPTRIGYIDPTGRAYIHSDGYRSVPGNI